MAFLKRYIVRIPRTIVNGDVRLRRCRLSDFRFLLAGLENQGIPRPRELHKAGLFLWLSAWWWMRKTFTVIYCIEHSSERVGFIGLYNLELGESSELTLMIFRREQRRCGYGSKAFSLLSGYLKNHAILDRIIVKTDMSNLASRTFWQKLGFREDNVTHDIVTMHIDLDGYPHGSGDTPFFAYGLLPKTGNPWQ